jgi:predicted porin
MNKKVLAVAVSSALAAPMAAHAVKYKLSGQVNRALVANSDGQQTDVQFVDNGSSGTRWRLTGSEEIGNGQKVGFNWEWQNSSNPNGAMRSAAGTDSQAMRKAEVWFSGGWGKVSLGQGDGAGNGTTEVDLSDTWNVAYTGRDSFGGAIAWRCEPASTSAAVPTANGCTADGTLTDDGTTTGDQLTHSGTFNHWDAFSRYDRVRYDSPALGPVTLAVSAGQNDLYEGAARWSQGIGGGQISAGLFYGQQAGEVDSRYGGSIAYLFSFGLSLQAAYAENKDVVPAGASQLTSKNWYTKIGYKWGNNAVSVGYGEAEDASQELADTTASFLGSGDGSGYKNKGFNIGFNHNIPKAKVDLYAGVHGNTLDTPSGITDVDDIYTFVVGTKLKFD